MSKRDQLELLTERVDALEQQVVRLTSQLGQANALLSDAARLGQLAEQARVLNAATDAGLRALEERAAPQGIGGARFVIEVDTVYHAETDGHVHVTVAYSGRTGRAQIRAGRTNPPTEPVTFPGMGGVSGVIRRGEYWMVVGMPPGRQSEFRGIFTPLY